MMSLEPALTRLALKLSPGAYGVSAVRRLSGGASQETWAFELDKPDGTWPLILRRRPPGLTPGSTTLPLASEAQLIAAAGRQGTVVPHVVHVCVPDDDLGEAYIMERVEGETLGGRIAKGDRFAHVRPNLARACGAALAQIHRMPRAEAPPLPEVFALDELAHYEALYRSLGTERPVFEAAFVWLRSQAPPPTEARVLHGDFRNGNLMVHPDRGLVAVLDWELAHLGDPASDLGWLCVNSWRFGGQGPVGGFGRYDDLLDAYAATGGEAVALDRILYWQALGSLKWGCMCLMMYSAYQSGADPSIERAMIGRRTSETEIDLVALMEHRH